MIPNSGQYPLDPENANFPDGPAEFMRGYNAAAEAQAAQTKPLRQAITRPSGFYRLNSAEFSVHIYDALAAGGVEAVGRFALSLARALALGDATGCPLAASMISEAADFSEKARRAANKRWEAEEVRAQSTAMPGHTNALPTQSEPNAQDMPYKQSATQAPKQKSILPLGEKDSLSGLSNGGTRDSVPAQGSKTHPPNLRALASLFDPRARHAGRDSTSAEKE
ncbi:MAG: hypothetical protein JWP91_780 [Fibrobacteres bacterium]|nr:hypothetical protein [Fibrobacterota bacterium]